jgi:trehalose-phosphatase
MKDILAEVDPGSKIALFLDYDGTLVPIRKTPEQAILAASRKHFLERLGRKAFVCVVSGRSLADIRKVAGISGISYIGNHGLEILHRGQRWTHPLAETVRPDLGEVLRSIRRETSAWPGILIEDKGLTGSIHYRLLPASLATELRRITKNGVSRRPRELRWTSGKKVFEIRPRVDWDKGRGVHELLRRLAMRPPATRIYIGDDQTDEDAFRALGRKDITIRVGRGGLSHARHRLRSVTGVWEFLEALLARLELPGDSQKKPSSERRSGGKDLLRHP